MYLLDSNVFIEAKNRYYAYDLCPGFWAWMDFIFLSGNVCTIELVHSELLNGKDELAEWMKERSSSSWILSQNDGETQKAFRKIAANFARTKYSQPAITKFLSGADAWLVAKASCLDATVVTLETSSPTSISRVPLPNICEAESVQYVDTFDFLRTLGAEFNFDSFRPKRTNQKI